MNIRTASGLLACACSLLVALGGTAAAQTRQFQPDKMLDKADIRTGWASHATLTVDATIKVHGAASLKSTGGGKDRFRKRLTAPIDVSQMRFLTFWYYIDKPELLGTAGGTKGQVEISSSGTFDNEEQNWPVQGVHLQRGWNYVVLELPGNHRGAAPIDLTRVNYFRIYHDTQGAITTRIDHVTFTNRTPVSSPLAQYLDLKRISRSTADVELFDNTYEFVRNTGTGDPARNVACRRLIIDLTHREISAGTLHSMGVSAFATAAELTEKRTIMEFICGQRSMSGSKFLLLLQRRAAADVAITAQIASLFDVTLEAAAQTREQVLQLDLSRIKTACDTDPIELGAYIETGVLPPSIFPGMNLLVKHCAGGIADIRLLMGNGLPRITDRRAAYNQCMASFTNQASECDNPYISPDGEYNYKINRLAYTAQQKADVKQLMRESLEAIESISVPDARSRVGETHARPGAPAADRAELERLHENYDQSRARIFLLRQNEEESISTGNHPPARDTFGGFSPETNPKWEPWYWAARAASERYADALKEAVSDMLNDLQAICRKDPQDTECNLSDDDWVPEPGEVSVPAGENQRCASMNFGDQNAWFERPSGVTGLGTQINETDRIDHCLCKLFDRGYGASLPGDTVQVANGCPTPEERLAQECLENPQDGIDGIKLHCRHLMQPISADRDALGARFCERVLPNCDAAFMKPDGDCGCGTLTQAGDTIVPQCPTGIPNCGNGIPAADGCGCQPFDSGANACMAGGKDFYLARDPARDLLVRKFPNKVNYADENLLLAKTGGVRFATSEMRRSQLFDPSQLWIHLALPGQSYDGTGRVNVSCTNKSTGRNHPIETIPLAGLSTSALNPVPVNLSAAERLACFGASGSNPMHLEFHVDTKINQPVAFIDILEDIGNIKPPCTEFPPRPAPGPRPLNSWPLQWTFSDGTQITPLFNGTGPIPSRDFVAPTLPPVCVVDGIPRPCS